MSIQILVALVSTSWNWSLVTMPSLLGNGGKMKKRWELEGKKEKYLCYFVDLLASSTISLSSSSLIVSPNSIATRFKLSNVITPVLSVSKRLKALSISASDSFSFYNQKKTINLQLNLLFQLSLPFLQSWSGGTQCSR